MYMCVRLWVCVICFNSLSFFSLPRTVRKFANAQDGNSPSSVGARDLRETNVVNQLATHVPDLVLSSSYERSLPHSQKFEGILMFADISGELSCLHGNVKIVLAGQILVPNFRQGNQPLLVVSRNSHRVHGGVWENTPVEVQWGSSLNTVSVSTLRYLPNAVILHLTLSGRITAK